MTVVRKSEIMRQSRFFPSWFDLSTAYHRKLWEPAERAAVALCDELCEWIENHPDDFEPKRYMPGNIRGTLTWIIDKPKTRSGAISDLLWLTVRVAAYEYIENNNI